MKKFYFILTFLIFILCAVSSAQASCGAANCSLVSGSQEGVTQKGRFTVDLSFRYIPQDDKKKGDADTDEVLVTKVDFEAQKLELEHHREFLTINKLAQFDLSYGVTDRFTVSISVPFFNDRYHEHDDEVVDGDAGEFNNVDGATGFGDISMSLKYALVNSVKHLLVAGAGVKFASGEFQLRDSDGGVNEPTIMPGTGSYDAILSAFYNYSYIPNSLDFFVSLSHRFTTINPLDYEFGDTTFVDGGVSYVLTDKVLLSAQINARISRRHMFLGMYVPNTGGTFINLTPGVRLVLSENASIYSHVQIPVYQRVNEANLVANYGFLLGATYGF